MTSIGIIGSEGRMGKALAVAVEAAGHTLAGGIGRALFSTALKRMASQGRREALLSPYTPNYFIPGVDVEVYPEAGAFLKATGWQVTS